MSDWFNWIPALTTTSFLGLALWLARSLILVRLKNSVQNEFDSKLEVLRSELKSKESQIQSLRSVAMSGLLTRQGALYTRKLQAIDQIWSALKELERGKYLCLTLGHLNFGACVKESADNPKFREFLKTIEGNFDPVKLDLSGSKLARPFLTPLAWAYYSAYASVIMQAAAMMQMLRIGVEGADKFLNLDSTKNLLKTVLPLSSEYIEKYGVAGHYHLLDEIEQLLLTELKNIQDGVQDDMENARRAGEINKEVENASMELAKMQGRV